MIAFFVGDFGDVCDCFLDVLFSRLVEAVFDVVIVVSLVCADPNGSGLH